MRLFILIALALPALAVGFGPARANLVTDPGFESCGNVGDTPPGWTASSANFTCSGNPHFDDWDAGAFGDASTLSQGISTVAGHSYDFSFWLQGPAPGMGTFTASFDGGTVLNLSGVEPLAYTLEDFSVTASGATTTISFTGSSFGDAWSLDDVSVTDTTSSAVPEPTSLALLGGGLGGLWRMRRRR
jgi:hypothetical protein